MPAQFWFNIVKISWFKQLFPTLDPLTWCLQVTAVQVPVFPCIDYLLTLGTLFVPISTLFKTVSLVASLNSALFSTGVYCKVLYLTFFLPETTDLNWVPRKMSSNALCPPPASATCDSVLPFSIHRKFNSHQHNSEKWWMPC